MSDLRTIIIDGREVEADPNLTVIQACEQAGIEIPRFCYHERLSIAGNCRMCLVEPVGAPKPAASCHLLVRDLRGGRNGEPPEVRTNSPMVRKAREGVMEFLLINHPLDCPICDQGGECDLQDQAMGYGRDASRYAENKRAVDEKDFGPLVKTFMTRCIHCTRCVRFMEEVAGVPALGGLWRGESMEIATTIERGLDSEMSGNIIDLCPVGALTSKPYAFTARSWELVKTESIDVLDAVGSNIRVDSRGPQVMRVLPRLNEAVNQEWIADKTRFTYDGLRRQRLDRPYVRNTDGKLEATDWQSAFDGIWQRIAASSGQRIAALAGDLACVESMTALKDLLQKLGSPHYDCRQDGAALSADTRVSYLFNTTIAGIDDADLCLLIGTNPRWEAPIINARLRERKMAGGFIMAAIGAQADLTYDCPTIGAGPETLAQLAEGDHDFAASLSGAERPMLILGMGALARPDGAAVLAQARAVAERQGMVSDGWNGFNVLHTAAARVGGLDIGFVPAANGHDTAGIIAAAKAGDIDVLFLLGADEIDTDNLGDCFVVYIGHHGDAGAHRADAVLPAAAYTEKDATYVNTEGRVQRTRRAIFAPGDAREDWTIIRALSDVVGSTLPYDNLGQLRARMTELAPHLDAVGEIVPTEWGAFGEPGDLDATPFTSPIGNYYMTDPISRASETMAACTANFAPTAMAAE